MVVILFWILILTNCVAYSKSSENEYSLIVKKLESKAEQIATFFGENSKIKELRQFRHCVDKIRTFARDIEKLQSSIIDISRKEETMMQTHAVVFQTIKMLLKSIHPDREKIVEQARIVTSKLAKIEEELKSVLRASDGITSGLSRHRQELLIDIGRVENEIREAAEAANKPDPGFAGWIKIGGIAIFIANPVVGGLLAGGGYLWEKSVETAKTEAFQKILPLKNFASLVGGLLKDYRDTVSHLRKLESIHQELARQVSSVIEAAEDMSLPLDNDHLLFLCDSSKDSLSKIGEAFLALKKK